MIDAQGEEQCSSQSTRSIQIKPDISLLLKSMPSFNSDDYTDASDRHKLPIRLTINSINSENKVFNRIPNHIFPLQPFLWFYFHNLYCRWIHGVSNLFCGWKGECFLQINMTPIIWSNYKPAIFSICNRHSIINETWNIR